MDKSISERFWSKVAVTDNPDDCWEWKASKMGKGYGQFSYRHGKRKDIGSARFSWILANGEIPDGLWVLHKCDNPACVNPNHLFLGTNLDNVRDMHAKGRANPPTHYGEQNPAHKLTMDKARYIRARYAQGGITTKQLGREMGVSGTVVGAILRGEVWKEENISTEAFIRNAFVSLGVDPGNIKKIHHSQGGFAPRANRWCVTLHHAVKLSALQVNWTPGLSGAVWNGNVCWVLVGKGE